MRHVLEHLYDPLGVIQKITYFMRENGIIYVAVPNLFDESSNILDFFGFPHISYFNKTTLEILGKKTGLKIIVVTEVKDEIYGIFKKLNSTKKSISELNDNYDNYFTKALKKKLKNEINMNVFYIIH